MTINREKIKNNKSRKKSINRVQPFIYEYSLDLGGVASVALVTGPTVGGLAVPRVGDLTVPIVGRGVVRGLAVSNVGGFMVRGGGVAAVIGSVSSIDK